MNERIKELVVKATDSIPDDVSAEHAMYLFQVKFAELIVKECMEQVWYSREDGINGNVCEVIKDRIKQHFGVEE